MSLTYSSNQSRQTLSRTAVIAFIVMLHAAVLIAFNNGIGRFFKINPPADLTVIDVPADPPVQKSTPLPDVPKAVPEQVMDQPIVQPDDLMVDIAPPVESQPAQADSNSASDVQYVDKLSLTSRVDPIYPASAQRAGQEGTVLLSITVDANGQPLDVQVERSSGFDVLDAAAVQAVKKWRFNHSSTMVKVRVPITFKLKQR